MHYRLLARCAVASIGALAFFTVALATPEQCRFEVHGRPLANRACDMDIGKGNGDAFEQTARRSPLVSVSIFASRKAPATGLLRVEEGRSSAADFAALRQDGRCWTNALIKACVVRTGAK